MLVERIHRHDAEYAVSANEDGSGGLIKWMGWMDGRARPRSRIAGVNAVVRGRRIEPAATGRIKEPATIVIRSPAPGLEAGERQAETRIPQPLAHGERRPAETDAERAPTIAVAATGKPRTIGIKIGEARNVRAGVGVLQRGVRCGGNRIDAAGDPVIEFVARGEAADADGRLAGVHRERLALGERSSVLLMKDGGVAREDGDVAAIVKIVDAEGTFAASDDRKIAAGYAEIVILRGIDVERSGALAENQARGAGAVVQGKIVELKNGVGAEESHGAILKFDFSTAIVGGENIALADGQIGRGGFPNGLLIGEGVAMSFAREAHIALDETEANDSCVAGVSRCGTGASRKSEEQRKRNYGAKRTARSHVSPPSGTLVC